jgi:hypothetical protein
MIIGGTFKSRGNIFDSKGNMNDIILRGLEVFITKMLDNFN